MILEVLDACTQIFHIALQNIDVLAMKALMPGLIECDLTHELAQIAESLLNPPKPLIDPLEALINVLTQGDDLSAKALDTRVEVVAHPIDTVADLLEEFHCEVSHHNNKYTTHRTSIEA